MIAGYILLALTIVVSLLLNGVRPSKTLAWLLAIFTIPVGGMLLYLLVGRNRRKFKVYSQHRRTPVPGPADSEKWPGGGPSEMIRRIIGINTDFPLTLHNRAELLKDGQITFERIFKALETARETIHVQYYIFEEGELADRLLELFTRKEAQGVEVRLLYDSIGSFSLSKPYLKRLREAGIEPHAFLPFRFGKFLSSLNYRNHRKIIVVDGKTAFTGGINISDKYLKGDQNLGMWHDMNLMLQGPAAAHLDTVFLNDWELVTGQHLPLPDPAALPPELSGSSPAQILATGPDDDFPLMEQLFFLLINNARHHIYITNPYLIPSQAIQLALQTAALGGVDVRILLSARADSRLVTWCIRSYFHRFLKSGIRIYLYPKGFLHSKVITVDDRIATVGTANMDNRSFQHNYEVNAVLYDPEIAISLKEDFLSDSRQSLQLDYESFRQRPWLHQLAEGAARVLSPVL
nr:cardiolipin synthase [Robiginitalea sp. SC105]